MTYDPKCYDLAAAFLVDVPLAYTERKRDQLAQRIQQAIEDFLTEVRNGY